MFDVSTGDFVQIKTNACESFSLIFPARRPTCTIVADSRYIGVYYLSEKNRFLTLLDSYKVTFYFLQNHHKSKLHIQTLQINSIISITSCTISIQRHSY